MDAADPADREPGADGQALRGRLRAVQALLAAADWGGTAVAAQVLHDQACTVGHTEVAAESALVMAKVHFNLDRLETAETWCERTRGLAAEGQLNALQACGWVVSAAVRSRLGHTSAAIAAVKQALDLLDDRMPAAARRTVYFGVAITYRGLGLWAHAVDAWRAAVETDRADDESGRSLTSRLNLIECALRAYDDLQCVDKASAEPLLHEMLALEGGLSQAVATLPAGWYRFRGQHMLGALRLRRHDFQGAVQVLRAAVAEEADHGMADRGAVWLELGWAQAGLGDHTAALTSVARARALLESDARGPGGLQPLPSLHDLWRAERLGARHETALALLVEQHQRVVRNMQALLDAEVAGLTRQLTAQTLLLQNADLRELNAGLARNVVEISRMAHTDPLTGVLNRRAIELAFGDMQREGLRVVVVMIDLDHFKAVNDKHSHAVGDAVLQRVTATLQEGMRTPDRLGRYGGEEFTLLLADTDLAAGAQVVERLRQRVAAVDWSTLALGLVVTVSAGLVGVGTSEDFDDAVARADRLLYEAKRQGRNRVVGGLPTAV